MVSLQHLKSVIEEHCIQSKTGNLEDCEDTIHTSEHYIAVIDGATSKRKGDGKEKPVAAEQQQSSVKPLTKCHLTVRHVRQLL